MSEPTTEEKLKLLKTECSRYRAQLLRCRQGMLNILEFRGLTGGRYGALTREEIEGNVAELDAVLYPADVAPTEDNQPL